MKEHYKDIDITQAAEHFKELIGDDDYLFLCIGTDRICADSLGPLVGTMLKGYGYDKVFGTLNEPVHAITLKSVINYINKNYKGYKVIAIDAAIGSKDRTGIIAIQEHSICPGIGVGKSLGIVGDISIIANVAEESEGIGAYSMLGTLKDVRLNIVFEIAKKITQVIIAATNNIAVEEAAVIREAVAG